ncbi:type II toxin-antitoxin system VapC family toxin [Azospirillum sp.]|uniref:type II toxin-antitoxin system VapC family toxin n=1 Tax=Azospirillum sp. TaxID=34012 RepID=UPI002D2AB9B2|nr:type II toxin-antitoxin system VapC family toxin [Azospirillum sp.]HYD69214.1 type II toxin-antitoxin system VapC family toxin [Azospirillum sp.]
MVVDTSAIIAFLRNEPEAERIEEALEAASECRMSAMTLFECRTVLVRRFGQAMVDEFHRLLEAAGVTIMPFDEAQAAAAYDAYCRFGKGSGHPAQLNLADCAAYALAKTLRLPLLFKGEDFVHTDVESVLV